MHGSSFRAIALGTLVILVLPGCAEVSKNPKTTIGALGGAAVGGLIAGAAGGGSAGIAARSHRFTPTRLRMVRTAGNTRRRSRSTTGRSAATGGHAGSRTAAGRLPNDHGVCHRLYRQESMDTAEVRVV